MEYVNQVLAFFEAGFAQVNAVQGIIIGLIIAFIMNRFGQILVMALAATVLHIVVDSVLPFARSGGEEALILPDILNVGFWQTVATLYVGYLIIISFFFVLKRMLLNR